MGRGGDAGRPAIQLLQQRQLHGRVLSGAVAGIKEGQVCIDGLVFALGDFARKHPGGDSIGLFSGSDCTVQYHMIHPGKAHEGTPSHRR